jgi:hypothetical protein
MNVPVHVRPAVGRSSSYGAAMKVRDRRRSASTWPKTYRAGCDSREFVTVGIHAFASAVFQHQLGL